MLQSPSILVFKSSIYTAIGLGISTLIACGPSAEVNQLKEKSESLSRELVAVTAERNSLKAQVEELSNTAPFLLAKITALVKQQKLDGAQAALTQITSKFPNSPEAASAQVLVDEERARIVKLQEDALRLEAIGFMALTPSPAFDTGTVALKVGESTFSNKFVMDRYDYMSHYKDADRDHKFVVLSMSATAPKGVSDPSLPGFALYWAEGKKLNRIGKFDQQFVRWEDFGSYIGNYGDSKNDFAKTATVNFTLGVQGPDDQMNKRPLYVIGTTKGCLIRKTARLQTPAVKYTGECDELEATLSLDSLTQNKGSLLLVRRID